jgi:hypothetical protein
MLTKTKVRRTFSKCIPPYLPDFRFIAERQSKQKNFNPNPASVKQKELRRWTQRLAQTLDELLLLCVRQLCLGVQG